MTKSTLPAGIKVGAAPSEPGTGNNMFWGVKERETVKVLTDASEIISIEQFAIWDVKPAPIWFNIGEDDPGHDLGLKPGYRAFLPVMVNVDGEEVVKIWSMPITVHRSIVELDDAVGGCGGQVLRVTRTGTGRQTKYSIINTGKTFTPDRSKIPTIEEIVAALGPDTREGIIEMIENRTGLPFSKVIEKMKTDSVEGDEL